MTQKVSKLNTRFTIEFFLPRILLTVNQVRLIEEQHTKDKMKRKWSTKHHFDYEKYFLTQGELSVIKRTGGPYFHL